eukprot:gene13350-biopygen17021
MAPQARKKRQLGAAGAGKSDSPVPQPPGKNRGGEDYGTQQGKITGLKFMAGRAWSSTALERSASDIPKDMLDHARPAIWLLEPAQGSWSLHRAAGACTGLLEPAHKGTEHTKHSAQHTAHSREQHIRAQGTGHRAQSTSVHRAQSIEHSAQSTSGRHRAAQ